MVGVKLTMRDEDGDEDNWYFDLERALNLADIKFPGLNAVKHFEFREIDPWEYAKSVNHRRRHLSLDAKYKAEAELLARTRVANLLKEHPEKTDRQIAKDTRREKTGDVSHSDTRVERGGRRQRASRPKRAARGVSKLDTPKQEPAAPAGNNDDPQASADQREPPSIITADEAERQMQAEFEAGARSEDNPQGSADQKAEDQTDIGDTSVDDPPTPQPAAKKQAPANRTVATIAELIAACWPMEDFILQALKEFSRETVGQGADEITKATNGIFDGSA
jgi:hypothetical protein